MIEPISYHQHLMDLQAIAHELYQIRNSFIDQKLITLREERDACKRNNPKVKLITQEIIQLIDMIDGCGSSTNSLLYELQNIEGYDIKSFESCSKMDSGIPLKIGYVQAFSFTKQKKPAREVLLLAQYLGDHQFTARFSCSELGLFLLLFDPTEEIILRTKFPNMFE